jgi:molybdopterin-biosynthesis enzyme MoeA-like protein
MIKFGDTTIVALPGIPKEMKPMFENSILPIVRKWTNGKFKTVNLKIRLGGDRFQILRQIQIEYPEVYFKTHSKPPSHEQQGYADGIDVTLLVRGESIDNCNVVTDMILQRFQKLVDERNGKLDIIM